MILTIARNMYSKLNRQPVFIPNITQDQVEQSSNETDDFMCIMRTDGSTITSKDGVTVKVKVSKNSSRRL